MRGLYDRFTCRKRKTQPAPFFVSIWIARNSLCCRLWQEQSIDHSLAFSLCLPGTNSPYLDTSTRYESFYILKDNTSGLILFGISLWNRYSLFSLQDWYHYILIQLEIREYLTCRTQNKIQVPYAHILINSACYSMSTKHHGSKFELRSLLWDECLILLCVSILWKYLESYI